MKNKKEVKTAVLNVSLRPDPAKFLRLRARGIPVGKAKLASGYSATYATANILKSKEARQIQQAIEVQRNQSLGTPGQTFTDCVEVAQEIRDNPKVKPNIRLQANRQIVDINGYEAPKEIHQRNESISLDMHTDDTDTLLKLVGML